MGSVIAAVIGGLIIGALARFVMPGKQNIGIIMTIVLGFLGSLAGSWLTMHFGYQNANGGRAWIPFFVGIACAVVLISGYLALTNRKSKV